MLIHLAKHVEGVSQNLVALKFRFGPVRSPLLDFERISISQVVAESIHGLVEDAVGFSLIHLEWTNLINHIVEHIAQVHGVEHAESEINGKLQSRLARGGFDAVAVFK